MEDLKYLSVPLPENILKLKWGGRFEACLNAIDIKLRDTKTSEVMKKRLIYEKELIQRIPEQYPFSYNEALKKLKENIADFKDEELKKLWESDACVLIFKDGEVYFHHLFYENLIKTRVQYRDRMIVKNDYAKNNARMLSENVEIMKANGERKLHMHLKTSIRIKDEAKEKIMNKKIRVFMPLPVMYQQMEEFRLIDKSMEAIAVAPSDYPQRSIVFETVYTGKEEFSTEYEVVNRTVYNNPDPELVSEAQPSFYLGEELPHIRKTPFIEMLTKEVVGDEQNPLLKAWKIYDYITSHVMYSFVRSYSTVYDIPEYVASSLKGDCGFQALMFISMCRCAGVPARWQSGLYATPFDTGSHDWAEYYVAPYGWMFADCSFGGSAYRDNDEERREYYRCNLDPYRICYASEFQHPFIIPCNALRNDPYDNQVGEIICEGKALLYEDFDAVYELKITE